MKLAYFDDYRLGVVTGEGIVDVGSELRDLPRRAPEDLMAALIEHFDEYRVRVEKAAISGRPIPPTLSSALRSLNRRASWRCPSTTLAMAW
jgi:hypothetical protein